MNNLRETIREMCSIRALAYQSIGDYTYASDGFCDKCPNARPETSYQFRDDGRMTEYVRLAVLEKLQRDGHAVAPGFSPVTGKEMTEADLANFTPADGGIINLSFDHED